MTDVFDRQELLVWGFIRSIEIIFKIINIPIEIYHIIYLYQQQPEQFAGYDKNYAILARILATLIFMQQYMELSSFRLNQTKIINGK